MCIGALAVAALLGFRSDSPAIGHAPTTDTPAIILEGAAADAAAIQRFYRARTHRPFWTDAAADMFRRMLANAGEDGLDPESFSAAITATRQKGMDREILLTQALLDYVRALRTPSESNRVFYVDAGLAPQTSADTLLRATADPPSATAYLAQVQQMHPLYERLRKALGDYRRTGINPTRLPNPDYEQALLINMDRLRALPADPGLRYILVNSASAKLIMVENGQSVAEMPVIVGRKQHQTPSLAGLIRFSVRNPYWNLPPDLIQARAARIASDGPALLEQERLELLSGWGDDARILQANEVDWPAVAAGTAKLRVRQLPGPDNMMGAVKFMLPNRLGIYLHDTPAKQNFARKDRLLSSGCVRVADAERLYTWLMHGKAMGAVNATELRVPLPEPVPVYILYLTAFPDGGSVVLQNDGYGRDPSRRS
ncbi:L,D-transpeptidase family protein [Sphingobium agri]|uniref:L,D-transpeptidase family protein n=1 Tax=Sphingobium agri TaxID=2933566 RepID=A0ABT0DZD7_9SPHN|nr:L,D-transpeptidase family protein [Sphingobium agri]MCK0532491.1 L,D-transpeptidase family protein [Sphingobium agri]